MVDKRNLFIHKFCAIFTFQILDKEIIIFIIIGIALILSGLLIHKGKAYRLIAGYEILKWRGVNMNEFGKIFFKGFIFMGIGILVVPILLWFLNFEIWAGRSLGIIILIGILYISIAGLFLSKNSE